MWSDSLGLAQLWMRTMGLYVNLQFGQGGIRDTNKAFDTKLFRGCP